MNKVFFVISVVVMIGAFFAFEKQEERKEIEEAEIKQKNMKYLDENMNPIDEVISLKDDAKPMPKNLIITNCDKLIVKNCVDLLGEKKGKPRKGMACVHSSESEIFSKIYLGLDANCKSYISFRKECEHYAKDICGTFHLRKSLKCLYSKKQQMIPRCGLLLDQLLRLYDIKV